MSAEYEVFGRVNFTLKNFFGFCSFSCFFGQDSSHSAFLILHFFRARSGFRQFAKKLSSREKIREERAGKTQPRRALREREREREQHISRHARANEGITDKDTSLFFFFFFFFFFFCVVSRASQNEARSDDVSFPSSSFLRSRIFVLD